MRRAVSAVLAALLVFSSAFLGPAHAGDAAAGKAKAQFCIDCHGPVGVSPHGNIPNLAGQKEGYLLKQLQGFARAPVAEQIPLMGGRKDALMSHQAEALSTADMENLAAYFASLPCGPVGAPPRQPPPEKAGRCVSCHGEDGRSPAPLIPNLAGQKEAYLERQLTLLNESRRGRRPLDAATTRVHPIMGYQAGLLDAAEIRTLARWYASLPCR
jgi:cytochrome c553